MGDATHAEWPACIEVGVSTRPAIYRIGTITSGMPHGSHISNTRMAQDPILVFRPLS